MTNLPIGQITQLTESPRPRMMPVHSPILQVRQNLRDAEAENANLRDLLNTSMVENAALLQQVAVMQEALNMQIKTFDAMKLNSDRALENWMNTCAESDKRIDELTEALDLMNERQRLEWSRAENAEAQHATLLAWSQAAYKRLGGLMAIGVSMTPDAVTAKLLSDAPGDVAVYSIYTDPLIISVAEGWDCSIDDLMEYAMDSVGASAIQTVEGCHSAGLHSCYGDLWTCKGCGNRFCDAEGSDNIPELCNECWWKAQGEAK